MYENYDSEKILREITSAIRIQDTEELKKKQKFLEEIKLEGILLGLAPKDYEEYHVLLGKTSIKHEVEEREHEYEGEER